MFGFKEKEAVKEDILLEAGIPEDYVAFFREYQKKAENLGTWHREKNGRFAMNFRHYMLEGMQKNIPESDLLLAAAILLSHCENYFRYVADPRTKSWDGYSYEIKVIAEKTRSVAKYMAASEWEVYGFAIGDSAFFKIRSLLGFTSEELKVPIIDVTITPGRYLRFFCTLPEMWGYKPKEE